MNWEEALEKELERELATGEETTTGQVRKQDGHLFVNTIPNDALLGI